MISQTADRRVRAGERQVMQYLRSCDWNIVAELPVAATAGTLRRLTDYGWIERQGGCHRSEIKLTPPGWRRYRRPSDLGGLPKSHEG